MYQYKNYGVVTNQEGTDIYSPSGKFLIRVESDDEAKEYIDKKEGEEA